ncbi:MAG: hypothetical protein JNL12_15285 [Planctomycetes bacterium]|nr:hypothetical protein [Planctomycetota bacterium]
MKRILALLPSVLLSAQDPQPTPPAAPPPAAPSSAPPAADAAARPADLEAFAARLDAAHHPNGAVAPIEAFTGTLELHLLDASAEQRGQVDLDVRFLEWRQPGKTRVRPLLRYQVLEAGKPIVRGRDRFGPWQLVQGKPTDLDDRLPRDRDECERHTNLARQLLRFLDPAAVVRGLQRPSSVRDEPLLVERSVRVECTTVEGDLAAFPLLRRADDETAVHVKVFVTKAEGRLLAVDAWPVHDGQIEPTRGERVLLLDLHERDGVLVPREVKHLFRDEAGKLRLQTRGVLTKLSLRPVLGADDFDRTREKASEPR